MDRTNSLIRRAGPASVGRQMPQKQPAAGRGCGTQSGLQSVTVINQMLANKEKNVMRTLLTASAATIALIIAAPVAAQRGTGSNHPSGTSMGGPSLSLPSAEGAMPEGGPIATQVRLNSQGPAHASSLGIHNASPSSALH